MSTTTYKITGTGENFIDLDLSFNDPTLVGETIAIEGSKGIDRVFVRSGLKVDVVQLGNGIDKIYLEGNFADYIAIVKGGNLVLTRNVNGRNEKVEVSAGSLGANDRLIFADGYVSSLNVKNSIDKGTPPPTLNTGETSQRPDIPANLAATVNATSDGYGSTFVSMLPGMKLNVTGGAAVDTVYVKAGSEVDATGMGGGSDKIYLTGRWAAYAKTLEGDLLTLTRSVNGHTEKVTISTANGAANDTLIFADGQVSVDNAKANLTTPIAQIPGYTSATWTPGSALDAPAIAQVADDVGDTTGPIASGGRTDDRTPTVKVTFAPVNAVGNQAMAGDVLKLYDGSTLLSTYTLTGTDIANGYAFVTTPTLNMGSHHLSATVSIGATANLSQTTSDFTFTITNPPVALNTTVTATEDNALILASSDFGWIDADGDALAKVKITTLATAGKLEYDAGGSGWVEATLNQEIARADLDAGRLRFMPAANANGTNYASVGFKVSDGTAYSASAATLTVNVTAVNDAPTGEDKTITLLEDASYTLTAADFGFSDPNDSPANAFASVKITQLETAGALKLAGVDVTLNQVIGKADLDANKLTYTPAANANGAGYANFTFQVQDDGGTAGGGVDTDASPNTITFDVTPANDEPTLSSTIDDVTNLDVRSDIVLTASKAVTAVAGKYIHIVNDGGAGYDGESADHSFDILATDTSKVTISGGTTITINPDLNFDLDLANNYHITVDEGAFVSTAGVGSAAVSDPSAMNFSTVAPGQASNTALNAADSLTMNAGADAMVAGGKWTDIGGVDTFASGFLHDLSGGNYVVLLGRDTAPRGGFWYQKDGVDYWDDGVKVQREFFARFKGVSGDDVLYIDDQFNDASPVDPIGMTDSQGNTVPAGATNQLPEAPTKMNTEAMVFAYGGGGSSDVYGAVDVQVQLAGETGAGTLYLAEGTGPYSSQYSNGSAQELLAQYGNQFVISA